MIRYIHLVLSVLFLFGCGTNKDIKSTTQVSDSKKIVKKVLVDTSHTIVLDEADLLMHKKPKNIILMIGDGMGLGQITAGMYTQQNSTALEHFPIIGLQKTHSASHLTTDSAASATAISSGVKTYNGAIGVTNDSVPTFTILEEFEANGLATGLVATSTIVHATPASFIAHNTSRRNYEEIATDFTKTEIDYFVGGGKKYFDRRDFDDRDILEELKAKGYDIYDYTSDFSDCQPKNNKNFGFLTADSDPLKADQGRAYLEAASMKGINYLKNKSPEGFFMMIEGSQIDWGGHANLSNYIITEFQDFDKTIKAVHKWAMADQETLLIVTADHETGGYAIRHESKMDSLVTDFISTKHTATMVPLFADGPGAKLFSGVYENTEIYNKMREALNWVKD